jgi:hypothetical protein
MGIAQAVSRFAAAASEVATAASATSGTIPTDTVSFSGAARAQWAESQTPEASLEHGLIEQGQAKHELAANVRVLQTADKMMGILVSLGAKPSGD